MKKNIYFEPPSRLQLLDKLKHFVRFSDFFLLVSGEQGVGKSALLEQLRPDSSDSTLYCCFLRPEVELNEQQLLSLLIDQLPSHEQSGADFTDQLRALHLQLKSIKQEGKKCLIAIDDAEYLSESALMLLLNLHLVDAQVLLTSGKKFADTLLQGGALNHLEGRVHHLSIESMSLPETAEYIALCHPVVASLPEKKRKELIRLSEGVPGRVETLLTGGKVSLSTSSRKVSSFPLPMLHMYGIGVLLIAIVAISLWQFMPDEPTPSTEIVINERVSVPLSIAVKGAIDEAAVVAVNVSSDAKGSPNDLTEESQIKEIGDEQEPIIKTDLVLRLQEQENKFLAENSAVESEAFPEAVPVPSELEEELRAVVQQNGSANKGEVPVIKEQSPSVSARAKKNQATEVISVKKTPHNKAKTQQGAPHESALLKWASSGYTLQMTGARSKQSALDFIAAQADSKQFYYFETIYKGLPWYVVIYGQYPNRDIANASIRKLPKTLQNVKPWARSIQGVQLDIKKKKAH